MLAYTYVEQGQFALLDKPKPVLRDPRMRSCVSRLPASAPATCISSTALCPALCPA